MFSKILIANRGEIACRVIKTARRLGIKTVAVYSEADAGARHVRMADEAVLIGPPPANESYLVIDRIVAAAKRFGAQAIHPGYGFLSENEAFCHACADNGLVFIGPPVDAIRAMGSKSEAKKLMATAGVPLVPGYHGENQEPEFLQAQADAIGYPVLIKASAGGGGKGMRRVDSSAEFREALASCRREAISSFGDDRVLIEKYILRPRHIEIQVFSDSHGNHIHLFERDCSVQRRHQKVLEEAPAPGLTAERRAMMGAAAVNAARAVGYQGAGTVEFIVDQNGEFHFMEMNTRLQVEHPVTEMITGLDLVEWQLRVAFGEPLPLSQERLTITGHSLEARIYAEDPDKGFLPSVGKLTHLSRPEEGRHVRIDTGVEEGDAISANYDPMIAKLIVWDVNRERALSRMLQALAEYRVVGVANNVEFLSRLVACPAFVNGDQDTGLIARETETLFPEAGDAPREVWLSLALAELAWEKRRAAKAADLSHDSTSPWNARNGWRMNATAVRGLIFRLGDAQKQLSVVDRGDGFDVVLDGTTSRVGGEFTPRGQLRADIDGVRLSATVVAAAERRHVFLHGLCWRFARVDPLRFDAESSGAEGSLLAPMPGKVTARLVAEGDVVEKGAPLLVIEAMKMELTISAPRAGVVLGFPFEVGDQVGDGDELVSLGAVPDGEAAA